MKSAFVVLGAIAGSVVAQGVTDKISPDGLAPEGCSATYDGTFEISIAQVVGAAKRGLPQVRSSSNLFIAFLVHRARVEFRFLRSMVTGPRRRRASSDMSVVMRRKYDR